MQLHVQAALPLAVPVDDGVPIEDPREPLRVLLPSLTRGGAERIVVDWLAAEAAVGRAAELALLHDRRHAYALPRGVTLLVRGPAAPPAFMAALARRWAAARAPVSTHLVGDDLLRILWQGGVRTVPVVHNARAGWRNDPATWQAPHVPLALACAEAVRAEMIAHGLAVPSLTLRHRPRVGRAATDPDQRRRVRENLAIGAGTFVLLALGAVKPQKDYGRAVAVLQALAARRDCVLVVAGGAPDRAGLAELDRVIDRALAAGVADRLRLPGFVDPVEPYLAAADALLNVSRYEGLSIAVREALGAGVPVVATDVGGQRESSDPLLDIVAADASPAAIAARLAALPLRASLAPRPQPRLPRAWSLALTALRPAGAPVDTLFVTANLNAGGAQRSLANLLVPLSPRHRLALAVCDAGTERLFAATLARAQVRLFRPAAARDPCSVAESLLAWASLHGARNLCLWNVDARVKLLLARFAPPGLRLIDVSPGGYAFAELDAAADWGAAVGATPADYLARLDLLVHKYDAPAVPGAARACVIPNGVAPRAPRGAPPASPRFLVSGRIAPSKRLDVILDGFARLVRARPDAQLHVIGAAEPRHADYAAALAARVAAPGVRMRGPRPDLAYLAEPFTAAVVLGTHQGSPNAVLEAMAAGIPVIANASGGTGALVRDGETGWLLREDCDAGELGAALAAACDDRARNARLGAAARAHVAAHHGIEQMVARYLAILAPAPAAA
ncbi:MAG: glycosyltransferase [Burkholderiales bacterium]|nr:glycosyltransferase [Burkholderiales bacterium]